MKRRSDILVTSSLRCCRARGGGLLMPPSEGPLEGVTLPDQGRLMNYRAIATPSHRANLTLTGLSVASPSGRGSSTSGGGKMLAGPFHRRRLLVFAPAAPSGPHILADF